MKNKERKATQKHKLRQIKLVIRLIQNKCLCINGGQDGLSAISHEQMPQLTKDLAHVRMKAVL